MTSRPKLKVAIAVRDRRVPRWQAALVRDASQIPGVEVTMVRARPDDKQYSTITPSLRRLDRADYLITRRLTSVTNPLSDAFIDLPIQTASFRKSHFDVVIDLGGAFSAARALKPKSAVWSLAFGKYLCSHDDYPCVEEVLAADEVASACLLDHNINSDKAGILGEAHIAVDRNSIFVTRAQALWAAPQLVAAALRQMADGCLAPARPLPELQPRPPLSVSGARILTYFLSGLGHAWRSLWLRDEWRVHYRMGADAGYKNPDISGFDVLPRLKNGFLADPFVSEREGRTVIFCEEYPGSARRGIISCVEIVDGKPLWPPQRVIEKPYHLSYPFLITEGEELFMIPESSAHNTVELYRCTRFPDQWQLEATLLENIKAADSTVAFIDGKYRMFTSVKRAETRNFDELHLYSSDKLTGPWAPHPGNPLRFDVRSARPAGALFQGGDSWIRPAQDGSLRYGRRISFQRITALAAATYAEEPAGLLDPAKLLGAEGVHTWNRAHRLNVIDSVRQIFRF